ncbi:hypothetical protein M422DRAFT_54583 [Sphaerobolus stellatus SS14]|uniref:Uncharacterized protein n=1 Tax=Sphaerobolus stellatus (strain SS14) TaxID=990650 RepID=A0A0C9U2W1_SPHS4|nr:hypothetical protein M422DRAFT_54583 [Sphaerobolus stellatus SS14]
MPQCLCTARGCARIPGGVTLENRAYRQHQRDEVVYQRRTLKNEAPTQEQTLEWEKSLFQAAIVDEDPIHVPTNQAESLFHTAPSTSGRPSDQYIPKLHSDDMPNVSTEFGQRVLEYQHEMDLLININASLDEVSCSIRESLEDGLLGLGLPRIPVLYPLKSTEELLMSYTSQMLKYNSSLSPPVREYAKAISEACNNQLSLIRKHKEAWLSAGRTIIDMEPYFAHKLMDAAPILLTSMLLALLMSLIGGLKEIQFVLKRKTWFLITPGIFELFGSFLI